MEAYYYLFGMDEPEFDPLPRWTTRGTNDKPLVWRRPKLIDEGVESEVFNLETAETRSSMAAFSTSIIPEVSSLWVDCLRWDFSLCFFEGRAFL